MQGWHYDIIQHNTINILSLSTFYVMMHMKLTQIYTVLVQNYVMQVFYKYHKVPVYAYYPERALFWDNITKPNGSCVHFLCILQVQK